MAKNIVRYSNLKDQLVNGMLPWTPRHAQLVAWYDAMDESTITESAGAVSQWDDKSGNGFHQVQANGALQPMYTAGQYVEFTRASAHRIDNASALTAALDLNNITIFALIRADDVSTSHTELLGNSTSGTSEGITSRLNITIPYSIGTISSDKVGTKLTAGVEEILSFYNNPARGFGYDHTFLDVNSNQAINAAGPSTFDVFSLGASRSTATRTFDGAIREVIISQGLTTDETRKMEGYLAHKWGQEGSLPVAHPYKTTLPIV